jgi:hypothetical protein
VHDLSARASFQNQTFMDMALHNRKLRCVAALHAIRAPANNKAAAYIVWKNSNPVPQQQPQQPPQAPPPQQRQRLRPPWCQAASAALQADDGAAMTRAMAMPGANKAIQVRPCRVGRLREGRVGESVENQRAGPKLSRGC